MQPVFLDFQEAFPTAVAAVVHFSAVQCVRMFHYFYIQGFKIIEFQSRHFRIDLPVKQSYGIFNQSLVFGLAHSCRKDNTAVMVCKSCKVIIYYRLYSTGLCYGRFEVVGNYGIGHTSKIMESIFTCLDKIFFLL